MNKKSTQDTEGEDGGGEGVGGDGGGRTTMRNGDGNRSSRCGGDARRGNHGIFHCLLPNVAEAVEFLEEATIEDVQMKVMEMTSVKYGKRDLLLGLKNGIKLGLFDVTRQFTVNSEQLNKQLKMDKRDRRSSIASLIKRKLEERSIQVDGGDSDCGIEENRFCKRRSSKRGKKMETKFNNYFKMNGRVRERLCDRHGKKLRARKGDGETNASCCRRKCRLNRKLSDVGGNSHRCRRRNLTKGESDGKRNRRAPSLQTTPRTKGNRGKESRRKKTPTKSKLRVDRNPLECLPPYYDIFT